MSNKMEQLLKVVINTPGMKHIAPKWVEQNSQRLAFRVALTSAYITALATIGVRCDALSEVRRT